MLIAPKLGKLSVNRQLELLNVPKSSYYYQPHRKIKQVYWDEVIKKEIMEIYTEYPFYGVPRTTVILHKMGYKINHKKVSKLRKELKIRTAYPRPRFMTSEPCDEHKKYPYLLRELKIEHPNQVWATDITYIVITGGRAFVIAIIDLYSRKVLSYCVVNTMDTDYCVDILKEAIRHYGKPEIFNSDQGSQFTSKTFTEELKKNGIKISMDGKGRCLDNAKMERFWWSLKYENIYLSDYKSLAQMRLGIQEYVNFYNSRRIHSSLEWKTPNAVYEQLCNLQSVSYIKSEPLHLSFKISSPS